VRHAPAAAGSTASILAVASSSRALQGSRREVNRLAGRYRGVERLDDGDREKFLLAIATPDAVHVATHVRVNAERPWYSSIQIGDDAEAGDEAGSAVADVSTARALVPPASRPQYHVHAHEIASAHTRARLVVLSGCESALGRATQGEGVLGLAAAFFVSGTRAVVASIWQVDDRATAELMERMYTHLAAGEPIAHALRMAQLDLRKERSHPFYWAGFVVIGDGDVAVRLEERSAGRRYWVVLAGLTVVAIVGWIMMKGRGAASA
jgi:CHAT domain-containing protein